jgi:hypothetical protein
VVVSNVENLIPFLLFVMTDENIQSNYSTLLSFGIRVCERIFLMSARLLVDCICREGVLVKCEACGEIEVNSSLPGLPELTLSFANPTLINDVRFHPCVRFRPWESNQILSFVPPDGQFKLMSYRCIIIYL